MTHVLEQIERMTSAISNVIWPIFLPILLCVGLYISIKTILGIKKETTSRAKMNLKDMIGPASISLGAMIGTGAIIGVLGSLSNLAGQGQIHIEAMAIWALIGSIVLIPLSYSETLISKIMKMPPKDYIGLLLSPAFGKIYAISFIVLYIFGFGGFQFSGIDAVATIITDRFIGIELAMMQRYLFVVIPLIVVSSMIVLSKKHDLFINSMTVMIGVAVAAYFIFFFIFVFKTTDHWEVFLNNLVEGFSDPVSMMLGIPLGLVLGLQRVLQTAESGLGALAMAAQESDSEPRAAAMISLIPAAVTVVVAILVTSYIASYGVSQGIIQLPADGISRLTGYIDTAVAVTGSFGLVVLSLFTLLSGLTTLLGSYYFLSVLLHTHENVNIAIYVGLITVAGTLAVFGFGIVFDVVDLLLFVVSGINVAAMTVFVRGRWKTYKLVEASESSEEVRVAS